MIAIHNLVNVNACLTMLEEIVEGKSYEKQTKTFLYLKSNQYICL